MTIDATIQRLTGDGEIIAQFLVDTLQGYTRDATVSHRLKSAEWLTAFGRLIPESAIPKSATIRPRPKSETKSDKQDKPGKRDKKPKVTEKQILHFDIARLIKQETNDGETIIEFLIRVISKIEETGENFTPAVRMRAARELLVRGFGGTIPGVRRILSGKTEDLDSYLSKIVREYTNYGADSIRFLVETMENKDPEAESRGAASFIKLMRMRPRTKPAEGFTASHRVWAACELLRRAYDIKTDHITYEDIQAYWTARTPAYAHKDDPGSPAASLKGFTPEYLETQAAKMRSDAEQLADAANIDIHATEKRDAAAEKIDADADKKPADANTPSANPGNPGRAARRREQRAERKTLKRIPLFPNRRRTREDVAEMLAFKAELESRRPAAFEFQRRQSEKRKAAAAQNIAVSEKSATTEQRDADKQPAAVAEKRNAAAEKPDVAAKQHAADAEKPDADKQPTDADKNPANDNTPSVNPGNPGRAARRREQRAARKAEKPADATEKRNAVASPIGEQPDADAEKPDADKQPTAVDKKPAADNTPSANPGNPGRAARRREQRAARKAEKRAAGEQPYAAANIAATKQPDADAEKSAAAKQPATADKNPADANTPPANPGNPGRAARRRQKRAARKAQKRKAATNNGSANNHANGKPRSNGSANTPAANQKNGKPQAIHATNGKTPDGAAAIILHSEPLSIEEWKRLRKTLAHPDNIPANARSP